MKNLKQPEFYKDKERLTDSIKSIAVVCFFSFFFYRNGFAVIFLIPVGYFYYQNLRKQRAENKKQQLALQFKDCLQAIATNLRAGYSVENAFLESIEDMKLLYGEKSQIVFELKLIGQGIKNNVSLEKMLTLLGEKSGVEDISEFADLFLIAKRSGGNMAEIIVNTATLIHEKMDTDRHIQVLLSAKKLEQKIMSVIPFAIVLYIGMTSKGFFDVLYHNLKGVIIMSICLLLYLLSLFLAEKIVNIQTS